MAFSIRRSTCSPLIVFLVVTTLGLALYILIHQNTHPAAFQSFISPWNQPHASDIHQSGNIKEGEGGREYRSRNAGQLNWQRKEDKSGNFDLSEKRKDAFSENLQAELGGEVERREGGKEDEDEETEEAQRDSRLAHQLNATVGRMKSGTVDDHFQNSVGKAVLASRNADGWTALNCDPDVPLRKITMNSPDGHFSMYIYNSSREDSTATQRALKGLYFEKEDISQFLKVSSPLPIIDVGANLGLITLQAAKQGRQVVAVEPAPQNALRLCRSVMDFGYAGLVRVIQNAVSSDEKSVSLVLPGGKMRTWYRVGERDEDKEKKKRAGGDGTETVFAIGLYRLLDVVPFTKAALKIDVEGHEGHVMAKAHQLFQEVDIPLVWMEWEHVKGKAEFGGASIVQFMKEHSFLPYDLMTGEQLSLSGSFMKWPFSVLWKKSA